MKTFKQYLEESENKLTGYHFSDYDIRNFNYDYIGSGSGIAYGYGIYLYKDYRQLEGTELGNQLDFKYRYECSINTTENRLIKWKYPNTIGEFNNMTGRDITLTMMDKYPFNEHKVSKELLSMGIDGVSYKMIFTNIDAYVIFDPSLITIVDKVEL